jgi:hypothetical protein
MLGQYLGRPPVWHTHWPRKQPDQKNVYGTVPSESMGELSLVIICSGKRQHYSFLDPVKTSCLVGRRCNPC